VISPEIAAQHRDSWRVFSACQQAVSSRAKSFHRSESIRLRFAKVAAPGNFVGDCYRRVLITIFQLRLKQKANACADAQIYGRFGVLGLLGYIDALLQPRNFHASDGEARSSPVACRFPRCLGGGGDHGTGHNRAAQVVGGGPSSFTNAVTSRKT